jgi:branched-chain amino acid transport system permease protein
MFLDYTREGRALKACAENAFAAKLMGINTQHVVFYSVVLSAALGAASGILIAPITFAQYDLGVIYTVKGFSAAVLGGIQNPLGAMVGGVLLGLLETFGVFFLSSGYKDVITLGVLLFVLFLMPKGIFNPREKRRAK